MDTLTHFNKDGQARMVDVSDKPVTMRTAVAKGRVRLNPETFALAMVGGLKKGDVLAVAQVAGIMAAKRTPDIIPMCHPVALTGVDISFEPDAEASVIEIIATARCKGETGVEMEALTAVAAAALTVYDMCKAVQKDIVIEDIRLVEKTGGKTQGMRVVSVNTSEKKGTVKKPAQSVSLRTGHGIEGDAHAGGWHRQISLLADESIGRMRERLPEMELTPGVFAENITTQGIELHTLAVGTRLAIGEAVIEITQIGKECHLGCEIRSLTGDCVMPREGVFAVVLKDGVVRAGDRIAVVLE